MAAHTWLLIDLSCSSTQNGSSFIRQHVLSERQRQLQDTLRSSVQTIPPCGEHHNSSHTADNVSLFYALLKAS